LQSVSSVLISGKFFFFLRASVVGFDLSV
jgi:hypothetical protein